MYEDISSAEHEELLDAKDYLASTGNEVNGLVVDGQFRGWVAMSLTSLTPPMSTSA